MRLKAILGTCDWLIFGLDYENRIWTWMTEMWEEWLDVEGASGTEVMIPFRHRYYPVLEKAYKSSSKPLMFEEFFQDAHRAELFCDSFEDPNEWSGTQPIHGQWK